MSIIENIKAEFNKDRATNLNALMIYYSPNFGDQKEFLKSAMEALVGEGNKAIHKAFQTHGIAGAIKVASFCAKESFNTDEDEDWREESRVAAMRKHVRGYRGSTGSYSH